MLFSIRMHSARLRSRMNLRVRSVWGHTDLLLRDFVFFHQQFLAMLIVNNQKITGLIEPLIKFPVFRCRLVRKKIVHRVNEKSAVFLRTTVERNLILCILEHLHMDDIIMPASDLPSKP